MHPGPRTCTFLLLATSLAAQATWTRVYPTTAPLRRSGGGMAFDAARGQLLLFGGTGAVTGFAFNDLWAWTGSQWQLVPATNPPPARESFGLVGDRQRQLLVLFGGLVPGGNPLNDTWELAGNQWTQRSPAHRPAPRSWFGMAFDGRRSRTVLFGGADANGSYFGDTWEWDGVDWLQRVPGAGPPARAATGLVYDPIRAVSLLYGGRLGNATSYLYSADTWTWDGGTWSLLQPRNYPGPSVNHRLCFDEARGVVVGHGFSYASVDPFSWEWDGSNWRIVLQASPGPFTSEPLGYDAAHRQVVLSGFQYQPNNNFGDTWIYATAAPATYTAFGTGCAGSAGTPRLGNAPYSWPWLGDTFTAQLHDLPANATLLLATGADAALPIPLVSLGMPGCDWRVDVQVRSLLLADASGAATWSLAIPNVPALAGASIGQQAFVLDAAAPGGATVSNAAELVVGIR